LNCIVSEDSVKNEGVTLNVTLQVPDGIVIASDSLLTLTQPISQRRINVPMVCPKCKEHVELKDVEVPSVPVPSSTFPYAQKLFSIKKRFGLAVYGAAFVNSRSIYNHVTELNAKLAQSDKLESVRDQILDYFADQIKLDLSKSGQSIDLFQDDWWPFGFQLAGFSSDGATDPVARVYWLKMGKKSQWEQVKNPALCTGDTTVVTRLWQQGIMGANISAFSLQDAIDYAKFLIRTTADFQRFSGSLPVVGGEIDIALVTNRGGFRWIEQKELYRILEKEESNV
jgi:hypothetical protein